MDAFRDSTSRGAMTDQVPEAARQLADVQQLAAATAR